MSEESCPEIRDRQRGETEPSKVRYKGLTLFSLSQYIPGFPLHSPAVVKRMTAALMEPPERHVQPSGGKERHVCLSKHIGCIYADCSNTVICSEISSSFRGLFTHVVPFKKNVSSTCSRVQRQHFSQSREQMHAKTP